MRNSLGNLCDSCFLSANGAEFGIEQDRGLKSPHPVAELPYSQFGVALALSVQVEAVKMIRHQVRDNMVRVLDLD